MFDKVFVGFSVESACVYLFLVFRRVSEYISLDLFYGETATAYPIA